MDDAFGIFTFVPGQSARKLEIIVAPSYQTKDDLVTAILIIHELTHALNYVEDLENGVTTNCYSAEAKAYSNQQRFVTLLNSEEKISLISRDILGATPELKTVFDTTSSIQDYPGNTYQEKAENFVKAQPYYQKQCGDI